MRRGRGRRARRAPRGARAPAPAAPRARAAPVGGDEPGVSQRRRQLARRELGQPGRAGAGRAGHVVGRPEQAAKVVQVLPACGAGARGRGRVGTRDALALRFSAQARARKPRLAGRGVADNRARGKPPSAHPLARGRGELQLLQHAPQHVPGGGRGAARRGRGGWRRIVAPLCERASVCTRRISLAALARRSTGPVCLRPFCLAAPAAPSPARSQSQLQSCRPSPRPVRA
jgi:hypothetical protein